MSSCSSWKNLWLNMKATPLISSTLASAEVFLFLKFAVIAMASFPLNSFLLKPAQRNIHRFIHRLICVGRDHLLENSLGKAAL